MPDWLVEDLRKYMELYPPDGPQGMIFTNRAGGALRRTEDHDAIRDLLDG